jgi:hypothetical protein
VPPQTLPHFGDPPADHYLIPPDAFARTYDPPNVTDPWHVVIDYQQVHQYANGHPNKGSQAVATALDMNRNRIRPWLDGGAPDAVRGLAVAHDRGWLDADRAGPIAEALVTLIAGVLAAGSISARDYRPRFAIDDELVTTRLEGALDTLGVGHQRVERDDPSRADELIPREHATVVGRTLAVLGCPTGPKTERTVRTIPELVYATPTTRARFVDVYVRSRATGRDDSATHVLQEDRPAGYRRALAELIADVTGEAATPSGDVIVISAGAARALGLE